MRKIFRIKRDKITRTKMGGLYCPFKNRKCTKGGNDYKHCIHCQ